jgi:hypothetical protein
MAQEVEFGNNASGKIRSFWVGLGLAIITLGIYYFCWYYFVNDELKEVGQAKDDQNLAQSSPAMSVVAVLIGGIIIIPPFLSVYNYGQRIKRAQRLGGIPHADQINPVLAFLLYFPGSLIIIPLFFHYWYVTKHQNMTLRAAAGLPYGGEPVGGEPGAATAEPPAAQVEPTSPTEPAAPSKPAAEASAASEPPPGGGDTTE